MKTFVVDTVPEWRYQTEAIARLHKLEAEGLPLACAGDQNASRRSRSQIMEAKALGMTAGEPDIRVYMNGGRLFSIEAKTPEAFRKKNNGRSKDQIERHARLQALGFEVLTLAADTPEAFADLVEAEIRARL